MAAYLIAQIDVENMEEYKKYAVQTAALAEKFGGKFLVKGGPCQFVEGDGPKRIAVVEFKDAAAAHTWHASPEYQAIVGIRHANSTGTVAIVEGV